MLDLTHELDFALELARECGQIALAYHLGEHDELHAEEKARGQGLVTVADTEIDAKLVAALRQRFPADGVLAEESAKETDRLERDRCWMVDPIDGTKEFASRDPSWAIHIGLCIEGRPVLGVVAQPAVQRLSWGIVEGVGRGAWSTVDDGAAVPVSPTARGMGEFRLVSSKSHSSPRTLRLIELLEVRPEDHLRTGSAGVKMSMVGRGEADVYGHPTRGTKLWDSCAPEALLVAAGGRLTDIFGKPLVYDDPEVENLKGLLATNGPQHDAIVELIAADVAEWFA